MTPLVAFALTFLTSPGRFQDEAKDWEFRPARWETMAPRISEAIGMPVQVNEKIRDEVVIGRFVHKTRDEMIAAFAKATGTLWTIEQGVLVIRPDGRARSQADSAMMDTIVANFQKGMDKANVGLVDQKTFEAKIKEGYALQSKTDDGNYDWNAIQKLDRYSPGTQLANLFLRQVGARELAKSNGEERIVYSMSPTQFQKSLGQLGPTLVSQAQAMQKSWQSAMNFVQSDMGHAPPEGGYYVGLLQPMYNDGQITSVLAVLTKQDQSAQVTLKFLDKDNNSVMYGNASANIYSYRYDEDSEAPEKPNEPKEPRFKSKVKRDSRDNTLGNVVMAFRSRKRISPEVRLALLKDMAGWLDHDPLDATCGRLLFALSKEANKDVAGRVPDSLAYSVWGITGTGDANNQSAEVQTLYSYLDSMTGIFPLYAEDEAGFSFALSIPDAMSGGFMPRRSIAFLASEYLKKGKLDFDTLSQVALATDSKREFEQLMQMVGAVIGGDLQSGTSDYAWRAGTISDQYTTLRLYGSLPKQAKLDARRGKVTLAVDRLPQGTQREIYKAILQEENGLVPKNLSIDWEEYQSLSQEEQQKISEEQSAISERLQGFGELANEPTFVLALPISKPLMVELDMGKVSKIFADNGQEWGSRSSSIDELARNQALSRRAQEQGQSNSYYSPFQAYAQYSVDEMTIKIMAGNLWEGSYVCDFNNDRVPDAVPLEKMPQDFQTKFSKLVEKYYKEYEDVQFGGSSSNTVIKP